MHDCIIGRHNKAQRSRQSNQTFQLQHKFYLAEVTHEKVVLIKTELTQTKVYLEQK